MVGQFVGDLKKTITGITALIRHFLSSDDISTSLSLFSSSSILAKEGKESNYEITLANNTASPCWARLLIDIYLKNNPVHPEGHRAYFEKKIFITSRENQRIKISYNWKDKTIFEINGVSLNPDNVWRGECETKGKYFVKAVLLNEEGKPFDQLTIVQNVV